MEAGAATAAWTANVGNGATAPHAYGYDANSTKDDALMPTKTCTQCGGTYDPTDRPSTCPHCHATVLAPCVDCGARFHPDQPDARQCMSCRHQERLF